MRIGAGAAALLTIAILAGVVPAASAQDDRAAKGGGRSEEILRRREALRERQEQLRRARQEARRGPMASEPFTALAKIGRQGTFNLVTRAGSVTITGSGGDDVRIEAVKRVWDRSDAAARAALQEVDIEVTERQGGVDVRTDVQRPRAIDAEVDFTIAVPAGASVTVRTGAGDVTVTGIRGELRAEAVGGSIKATSVGQVRLLRTLSGAVSLENGDSSDLTISTLGGPVTIRQLKARSADLRTVAGDLIISDSETERLIVQSLSGRIEFTGRLAPNGRYSLQSQSGMVRLTPLGSDDFELEAATVTGSVRSDFAITLDDRQLTGPRDRGPRLGRGGAGSSGRGIIGRGIGRGVGRGVGRGTARGSGRAGGARILRGVSGSGGPLVTVRSFSGDITIARR
jgi:hypothetical protein